MKMNDRLFCRKSAVSSLICAGTVTSPPKKDDDLAIAICEAESRKIPHLLHPRTSA